MAAGNPPIIRVHCKNFDVYVALASDFIAENVLKALVHLKARHPDLVVTGGGNAELSLTAEGLKNGMAPSVSYPAALATIGDLIVLSFEEKMEWLAALFASFPDPEDQPLFATLSAAFFLYIHMAMLNPTAVSKAYEAAHKELQKNDLDGMDSFFWKLVLVIYDHCPKTHFQHLDHVVPTAQQPEPVEERKTQVTKGINLVLGGVEQHYQAAVGGTGAGDRAEITGSRPLDAEDIRRLAAQVDALQSPQIPTQSPAKITVATSTAAATTSNGTPITTVIGQEAHVLATKAEQKLAAEAKKGWAEARHLAAELVVDGEKAATKVKHLVENGLNRAEALLVAKLNGTTTAPQEPAPQAPAMAGRPTFGGFRGWRA